jgi:thioesterase domain-containing protein
MDAAWIERKLAQFKGRLRAARDYRPEGYAGQVTLFRCDDLDPEDVKDLPAVYAEVAADPTLGWRDLACAPVEVLRVPGSHANLCAEPHVGVLAEQMKDCLDRAFAPRGAERCTP